MALHVNYILEHQIHIHTYKPRLIAILCPVPPSDWRCRGRGLKMYHRCCCVCISLVVFSN